MRDRSYEISRLSECKRIRNSFHERSKFSLRLRNVIAVYVPHDAHRHTLADTEHIGGVPHFAIFIRMTDFRSKKNINALREPRIHRVFDDAITDMPSDDGITAISICR